MSASAVGIAVGVAAVVVQLSHTGHCIIHRTVMRGHSFHKGRLSPRWKRCSSTNTYRLDCREHCAVPKTRICQDDQLSLMFSIYRSCGVSVAVAAAC